MTVQTLVIRELKRIWRQFQKKTGLKNYIRLFWILDFGAGLSHERGADVHRKFWTKPLKKTSRGLAQAFFDP